MPRIVGLLMLVLCLGGCARENREIQIAMELRDRILSAENCGFHAAVTADYGDILHSFSMDCTADTAGMLSFEIREPESIAGIRGSVSDNGGSISYENDAIYFPLMAEDLLVPAAAPWVLMKALRGGNIRAAGVEEEYLHIVLDDSFAEDALQVDVWLDEKHMPVRGDILHNGIRILSADVENFVFAQQNDS